jgi:hypothetical protein
MARKKFDIIPGQNFKYGKLEQQNVFVGGELKDAAALTGMKVGKQHKNALIVQGEVIKLVSDQYGFLRNEEFFGTIEQRLKDAGIGYDRRSINRDNRSFRVDYILNDDSFHVNVKGSKDKIKPMVSAQSSYDGSTLTGGHLGFFREICSNGAHVAQTQLQFKLRRRANIMEVYVDKIEETIAAFMDNEFYSLHEKFEVMAESPVSNVEEFVKYTLGETGLFKYEKSEKNPDEASAGARFIIDTINAEAKELGAKPNLWLGYNAFNEYIHTMTNKVFMVQDRADKKVFAEILSQIN